MVGSRRCVSDSAQEERKNKCLYCSARFKKACHLYRHERQIHRVQSLNRRNKIQYIPGTDNYVVGITPATKKPVRHSNSIMKIEKKNI